MSSPARLRKLEAEYNNLGAAFGNHPDIDIRAIGDAPHVDHYMIVYRVPALRQNSTGQPMAVRETVVEIMLPEGYPRIQPVCRTVPGDVIFHPNFNAEKICIVDDWSPSIGLVDIVNEIGEMLQWKKFNIRSPLNAIAAEWSQDHLNEIPLGN
jgi:ubiquitin-protein ligase